jgi:hypothetical protein
MRGPPTRARRTSGPFAEVTNGMKKLIAVRRSVEPGGEVRMGLTSPETERVQIPTPEPLRVPAPSEAPPREAPALPVPVPAGG